MKANGSCFCHAIAWEAEVDPGRIGICHCRDCQIFSGSAFRMSAMIPPTDFRFTKGTPTYFDKTADSGKVRRMAFCAACGTHLASLPTEAEAGAFTSVRIATSAQIAELKPIAEIFCDSKLPWQPELEGAWKFSRMPAVPNEE